MSRRPHGRASVDPSNPRAFGICDACGFLYNLEDLHYQHKVAGGTVVNTNMRRCEKCTDDLQLNLMTITLPPDPMPVVDPRVENFAIDEIDYLSTQNNAIIETEDGDEIVTNEPSENFGSV